MDAEVRDLYAPLIGRVTSVGCDMTTDEATEMLDALLHGLAERQRAVNFDSYEEDVDGALLARDHLADMIDPATP
jgi:hypothetical protein